ncbi:MAG: histidinol dehydrogenase, partial [Deltaproteobacteria bacterium]|nr:histidinol dehydrogenase [Deltaproteobacteria bacterium]
MAASRAAKKGVLKVLQTSDADFKSVFAEFCKRSTDEDLKVEKTVREILSGVREGGDKALRKFVKKYDGAELKDLEVSKREWEAGIEKVDSADRAALGKAATRVRNFHRRR